MYISDIYFKDRIITHLYSTCVQIDDSIPVGYILRIEFQIKPAFVEARNHYQETRS